MENKKLLIILISIFAVVIVAVVGLLIFLHFTNPEILTKTLPEIISGETERKQNEQTEQADVSLANFIVPDEVWENSSIFHALDGTRIGGGISFSEIPIGTKIFAPMDGYIHTFSAEGENETLMGVVISRSKNWSYPYVTFMATGFRTAGADGSFVEKGDSFAEITDNTEWDEGLYDKSKMLIVLDKTWADKADNDAANAREYIKRALEKIN